MYPRLLDFLTEWFGLGFQIPVYSFGAMVALAAIVAGWMTGRELDRMYAEGQVGSVRVPTPGKKDKRGRPVMTEGSPSLVIWNVTVYAVLVGFVGAKLFHIFENWDAFTRAPGQMLFSSGGFTFYGGLIVAAVFVAWYLRRLKIDVGRFADAVAPGLMLGYGIGRIGCYLAGDGDWGVCSNLADKPGWIPDWLWSETFPNNLLGPNQTPIDVIDYTMRQMQEAGMNAEVCVGASGVYPTMLYEFAMAAALTAVLWAIRKHAFAAGWLFFVYLVFNGAERFIIEQIRVNNVGEFFGVSATQAEVIAVVLMLAGVIGAVWAVVRRERTSLAP
jgi:phosphatidylglycerol:prolipoprotein diacylglycerol transferase